MTLPGGIELEESAPMATLEDALAKIERLTLAGTQTSGCLANTLSLESSESLAGWAGMLPSAACHLEHAKPDAVEDTLADEVAKFEDFARGKEDKLKE
jgi:hypothetical protein